MNKKEKQAQIALGTYLPNQWKECQELRIEGYKLYVEGYKLITERNKLYKGHKLIAEGHKLIKEGNKLYEDVVIEVYGAKEVTINWNDGSVKKDDH